jgi:hypothetical protein
LKVNCSEADVEWSQLGVHKEDKGEVVVVATMEGVLKGARGQQVTGAFAKALECSGLSRAPKIHSSKRLSTVFRVQGKAVTGVF